MRRVLLVEPYFHVHALVHCEAALASAGFGEAEVVIASGVLSEKHRARIAEFIARQPRARFRALSAAREENIGRRAAWRIHGQAMREVEAMLQSESFDLVAYMMADNILPYLAFRRFQRTFPAHWKAGTSGLVFRDNGLRPPTPPTLKSRVRAAFDRLVLRRALQSPGVRRLAFFDPWCAERARALWGGERGRAGVDPIFLPEEAPEAGAARAKFQLAEGAFAVLLFGALSERKGIVQTLDLLRETALPRPLHVLIGGPVDMAIRERFDAALAALKARHTVSFHDGFVPDAAMPEYFAAADLVVCAYRDFTGSSGILLHAAAHGKPALVSPGGVMAEAVERHDFGAIVDLDRPATFHQALARFAALGEPDRAALAERARGYAKLNDARLYLSQFL